MRKRYESRLPGEPPTEPPPWWDDEELDALKDDDREPAEDYGVEDADITDYGMDDRADWRG